MFKRAGISSEMKKLPIAAALAAMLSASGGALAASIDEFGTPQGPAIDNTTAGGEETDGPTAGRTIGANMTVNSGAGVQVSANIAAGVFGMDSGVSQVATTRVTWTAAAPGFISDLSSTSSINVNVTNWGAGAGQSLTLSLTGGVTRTLPDNSVSVGTVVFPISAANFPGVNLGAITEITLTLADTIADGSELDAAIAWVRTVDPAAPPPVIPPGAGIPILPPLGMAFAAFGLAGIGAWRSRRKKSAK